MIVKLRPDLAISEAEAQAIVDRVAPGRALAGLREILAGKISAVFEIELAGGAPSFVLKVYPEALRSKMRKTALVLGRLEGKMRPHRALCCSTTAGRCSSSTFW